MKEYKWHPYSAAWDVKSQDAHFCRTWNEHFVRKSIVKDLRKVNKRGNFQSVAHILCLCDFWLCGCGRNQADVQGACMCGFGVHSRGTCKAVSGFFLNRAGLGPRFRQSQETSRTFASGDREDVSFYRFSSFLEKGPFDVVASLSPSKSPIN